MMIIELRGVILLLELLICINFLLLDVIISPGPKSKLNKIQATIQKMF